MTGTLRARIWEHEKKSSAGDFSASVIAEDVFMLARRPLFRSQ